MAGLAAREYAIEEYTRTVCPRCFEERQRRSDEPDVFVDGMLVSHSGRIWLRRFCQTHGETESLYEEDAEIWRSRAGWGTPTLHIVPDRATNFGGFPNGYREGLPASHGQHTCILLLNVTERCNYACPTCYAAALSPGHPAPSVATPSIEECLHTVDTVIAREGGKLGVVMLSGGEPTVRRDIEELIERLLERNITRVMLNSNGRRILRDDRFAAFLEKNRARIEVYLQFDGFRPGTHKTLRGEDVGEEKTLTLARLNGMKLFTTLVMTVAKGVNDDEVGAVLKLGLETPRCAGMAIQPVFGSGRGTGIDGRDRATPTGVLRRLSEQTDGLVSWEDFIPLPCSHRDCCDITYLIRTKRDGWRSLPKLLGRDELKKWIHVISNTISFDVASEGVKALVHSGALQRVFSEQQKSSAINLAADIFRMCDCVPGLSDLLRKPTESLESMAERTFRVTTKMFMDSHTFHEARIRQCCVHVGTFEDDPRRHSFCWRWLFADAEDLPAARKSTLRMAPA
jgi:uncharacterized radical SAM superfamily Fe-S cluster-containing enzyme